VTRLGERGEKCKPDPISDSQSKPNGKRKGGLRVGNARQEGGIARRGVIGSGSLRSGNRRRRERAGRTGRVAIGGGAEGPRGREAGPSLHQWKKQSVTGLISSEFAKFSLNVHCQLSGNLGIRTRETGSVSDSVIINVHPTAVAS
jgi:hypothetical protein